MAGVFGFVRWWCGVRENCSATVSTLVAFGAIAMVGAAALAADSARGYMVKGQLVQALDAAALAGGRAMFSPTRDDDIRMYFNANFSQGYLGATVQGPTITVDQESEVLTLTASATIDTTFMRILGHQAITVSAMTEVTRRTNLLDVMLAMDMSGSMAWDDGTGTSRIAGTREAALSLVGILFGEEAVKPLLKIAVVPWNGKVNVTVEGTAYDPAATTAEIVPAFTNPLTGATQTTLWRANNSPVALLEAPAGSWKGCAYSRYLNNTATDDDADTIVGSLSFGGGDWLAWEPIGPEGEPVSGWQKCALAIGNEECRPCLGHGITPLSDTRATIDTAINALTSPTGTTNITQGLGWAWRVLVPEAPFTEADPNPQGKRKQAIVLLTDGENFAGPGDGYKAVWGHGYAGQGEMDGRLRELAENVKAAGITLYVIQFANSGGALQTLLKQIATGPDAPFYHYAPNAAALSVVFQEVANHLSELRLSK